MLVRNFIVGEIVICCLDRFWDNTELVLQLQWTTGLRTYQPLVFLVLFGFVIVGHCVDFKVECQPDLPDFYWQRQGLNSVAAACGMLYMTQKLWVNT